MMITAAPPFARSRAERTNRHDRISFSRLVWVAPLTVALSVALSYAIKFVVQALDPRLVDMAQLGTPMVSLTVEGAAAAIVVFAFMAAFVRRPVLWYRIVATVALLVSVVPDVALGIGGAASAWGMQLVAPFLSLSAGFGSSSAGGPPPSGAPSGAMPGTSLEEVVVLVLLHVATFAVCVVLLTTLTRKPALSR